MKRKLRKIKLIVRGGVNYLLMKLFRPKGFKLENALIICGSTRCGSTWMAELLSALPGNIQIFEPLHSQYVPEAKSAGVKRNMYLTRADSWLPGRSFIEKILKGQLVSPWLLSQVPSMKIPESKRLVVKFVRANMMLDWLCQNFPSNHIVLMIRHPCAVIASQLSKGWTPDLNVMLSNPYFENWPEIKQKLTQLSAPEELAALAWCMRYHAPLTTADPQKYSLMCYERLVRNGQTELNRLFSHWQLQLPQNVIDQLDIPSDTVATDSHVVKGKDPLAGWKNKLSESQIQNILKVLAAFDLGFYSEQLEPDYEQLYAFPHKYQSR